MMHVCYSYTAIYNFAQPTSYAISLTVGEVVQINEESVHWYYGRSKLKNICGIFPKSYIHILQKSMTSDNLVHEITNVLREWEHHWKHLYVVCIQCFFYIFMCVHTISFFFITYKLNSEINILCDYPYL